MYVFDLQGTLVNNPTVSDEDVRKMLVVLRDRGHRLVIMTGNPTGVPHRLSKLVDECWTKPISFQQFNRNTVVFDDDTALLRAAARAGAKVVAATQMGAWLENEVWTDGTGRQDR